MMGREYPDGHPLYPNAHAKMDGHDRGGLAGWHAHKMWGRPYHTKDLHSDPGCSCSCCVPGSFIRNWV